MFSYSNHQIFHKILKYNYQLTKMSIFMLKKQKHSKLWAAKARDIFSAEKPSFQYFIMQQG